MFSPLSTLAISLSDFEAITSLVLVGAIICAGVFSAFTHQVPEGKVVLVNRWGKPHRVREHGLHLMIPLVDRVAHTLSLETRQFQSRPAVTTAYGAVIEVPIKVLYYIDPGTAWYTVFSVKHPNDVIEAAIRRVTEHIATKMDLMDIPRTHAGIQEIQAALWRILPDELGRCGFKVTEVTVSPPALPSDVMTALRLAMAMQRLTDETGRDPQGILTLFKDLSAINGVTPMQVTS